ncbi:sarcosine oxidase subunit delta [Roseomonas sp. JC162]|uniref:Sarcosine oxidase subunit delta n=1 Tax=Neoroseomonas marina TaxID=1232220 RepID=A0A848EEB4_9PROT|nr:sarcosine oxidase subunit delta [Neoroseomonas marina]NMJ42934.1 sarcosine oxidase subunit delta [Neoroseomonas marina]
MLRIPCPHCGARDEVEFIYRGDATVTRPGPDGDVGAFHDYLYLRRNPRGWQVEWWQHNGGCRTFLKVLRHTVTHEVRAVATATETLEVPGA